MEYNEINSSKSELPPLTKGISEIATITLEKLMGEALSHCHHLSFLLPVPTKTYTVLGTLKKTHDQYISLSTHQKLSALMN